VRVAEQPAVLRLDHHPNLTPGNVGSLGGKVGQLDQAPMRPRPLAVRVLLDRPFEESVDLRVAVTRHVAIVVLGAPWR
jgi:hypothetical protein